MDDRRLISLSDDDDTLGSFADEGEAPAADAAEIRHFFGPGSPESELPSASADDWPLDPRPAFATASPVASAPIRRISLPDVTAADNLPHGLWRYAPGWKTVAVLAALLLLGGARVVIPILQRAASRPPTFTMAQATTTTRPGGASQAIAPPPATLPPTRVDPAPTAALAAPREPVAPLREAAPPEPPAVARTVMPAPTPARVEPVSAAPAPRAAVAPPAVTNAIPAAEPRLSAAMPTPPPTENAPSASPALTTAPAAAPAAAAVTTPRVPPPPAVASPTAAPPVANASSASAVRTTLGDENAVRFVLERYRAAYSALNADDAKAVWPSVDAKTLSKAFEQLQSQELQFANCQVAVSGDRANATCGGQAAWVPKVGSRNARSTFREWNFNLRRAGDRWLIAGVDMR